MGTAEGLAPTSPSSPPPPYIPYAVHFLPFRPPHPPPSLPRADSSGARYGRRIMSRPEDANGHITNHEIEAGQRDGLLLQEKTNTGPANASYFRHALAGLVEVLK